MGESVEHVETVSFDLDALPRLRGDAAAIVERGRAVAEEFLARCTHQPPGGFFAGDYEIVATALDRLLRTRQLRAGKKFCEWGSGVGVITLLAQSMGFDAAGIEVQEPLVRRAKALAAEFGLAARFAHGTYVPSTGFLEATHGEASDRGDESWTGSGFGNPGPDGYDALGWNPGRIDVFYVYPPPIDEDAVVGLFGQIAAPGAHLLLYRGEEELELHRRTDAVSG